MIKLFERDVTIFEDNGIAAITNYIFEPVIEETLNGLFSFSFKIPIFTKYGKEIKAERIITAPIPDGSNQPFRINKVKPSMGILYVEAYHIFYDLADNFIEDMVMSGTGQSAGSNLLSKTQYPNEFEFISNITQTNTARIVRYNPVQALLDDSKDNTFINRWGGEIERNGYRIIFNSVRGTDRGVRIKNKKNLVGYEATIDYSSIVTRILPMGYDGLKLPEFYVDSPQIGNYLHPKIKEVEYQDVKVNDNPEQGDIVTKEQAYELLRELASAEFSENHVDEPTGNYKVNFVDLSQTKEYRNFKALEKVLLGDTVHVDHTEDNFHVTSRIIKYKWNPISKRYIEIEMGSEINSASNQYGSNSSLRDDVNSAVDNSNKALSNSDQAVASANGKTQIWHNPPDNPPTKMIVGDIWFKEIGDETELWEYVEIDGIKQWQMISSTKDVTDAKKAGEEASDKAEEAKKAAEDAKTAGENAQLTADQAKKAGQDAQLAADAAAAVGAEAKQIGQEAKTAGENAQLSADQAKDLATEAGTDASQALTNANNAVSKANEASSKADQSQLAADQAKSNAADAITSANQAKVDAGTALGNANQAISDATNALNQANLAKEQSQEAIDKYLAMGMSPAWSWSPDGTDRFTKIYPGENLLLNSTFEKGFEGWTNGNAWVVDTETSRNGKATIKGTFTSPSTSSKALRQTISIEGLLENDDVVWSIWAKSDKSDGQLHLEILGSVYMSNINVGTEWTRISLRGKLKSIFAVFIWNSKAGTYWISEPKLEKGTVLTPYVPAKIEDYSNAVPSYIGFSIETSDNPADYIWIRNPEKLEGEVKVELTEINGELSRKVSQENFDQLNGTVTNHSTLISQNQNDIKLKANQSEVNTLTGRVSNAEASITVNANAISQKANQTTVDSLSGRVTTAEGSITTLAGKVELKANQTIVDTLAERMTSAESQLTVQSNQISQTVSKTELNNTLSGYATQTWTQGQIKTASDTIQLSVSQVQSNLDNLEIGGRNWLKNAGFDGLTNWISNSTVAISSEKLKGYNAVKFTQTTITNGLSQINDSLQNLEGILSFWARSDVQGAILHIEPHGVGGGSGSKNFSLTSEWKKYSNKISFGTNGKLYFWNNTAGAEIFLVMPQFESGDKVTDFGINPDDLITDVKFSTLELTVESIKGTVQNKADQSQVTQLANQITSIVISNGSSSPDNLIGNGDFEKDITNSSPVWWEYASKMKIVANVDKVNGNNKSVQCGQIESNSTGDVNVVSPAIKVISGASYSGSIKVRWNSPSAGFGGQFLYQFQELDGSYAVLKTTTLASTDNVAAWRTLMGITVKTLSNTEYVKIWITNRKNNNSIWIDDVELHRVLTEKDVDESIATSSQITQLSDDINLRVQKGDVINQINVSTESILIAGNKVHITGQTTIDNAVIKTANIVDLAVTNAKIGALAVNNAKIADLAVSTAKIDNLAVSEAKIAALAVTNAKIGNLAVSTAKIADLAVSEAKIGNLAVTSAKIKDAAITSAKIGTAAIGTAHIGDGVITNAKIGALSADKITAGTLNAANVNVINLDVDKLTGNKATFIQAGFNGINSNVQINSDGLVATHNDGSQTIINANGLFHKEGGTTYETHYLTYQTYLDVNNNVNSPLNVQLPAIFKGKQFKVRLVLSDTIGVVNDPNYYSLAMLRVACSVLEDEIDYANAIVPCIGYSYHKLLPNGSNYSFKIRASLTVTL